MKEKLIIRYIKRYLATGVIDDHLIKFYDQHGKWRGDTIRWKGDTPHTLLAEMNQSYLPASRRTSPSRRGTILKTSLVSHRDDYIQCLHTEIQGSLIVLGNAAIHAPNLRRICGNFISGTRNKINMPWLTQVSGNVELLQTFLLQMPRLRIVGGNLLISGMLPPLLLSVGGRLAVYWAFDLKAPVLRRVGGSLVLSKAGSIVVPSLETVRGGILLSHLARRIIAPRLRSVGGDFLAGTVEDLDLPRLRVVWGDFDTGSASDFYDPAIRVKGDWTISSGAIRRWELRTAARKAILGRIFDI